MNYKTALFLSVFALTYQVRASEFSEIHWRTKCEFAVGLGNSFDSFAYGEFSKPEYQKVKEKLPSLEKVADDIRADAAKRCKEKSAGDGGTPFYDSGNKWFGECNKFKDDKLNVKCRKIFNDYLSKFDAFSSGSERGIKLALAKRDVHCPTDSSAVNDSLRNSPIKEISNGLPTNSESTPQSAVQQ